MKFGKRLRSEQVNEWAQLYIPYGKLKKLLKAIRAEGLERVSEWQEMESSSSMATSSRGAVKISRTLALDSLENERLFFKTLNDQLNIANEFYVDQVARATARFEALVQVAVLQGLIDVYIPGQWSSKALFEREILEKIEPLSIKVSLDASMSARRRRCASDALPPPEPAQQWERQQPASASDPSLNLRSITSKSKRVAIQSRSRDLAKQFSIRTPSLSKQEAAVPEEAEAASAASTSPLPEEKKNRILQSKQRIRRRKVGRGRKSSTGQQIEMKGAEKEKEESEEVEEQSTEAKRKKSNEEPLPEIAKTISQSAFLEHFREFYRELSLIKAFCVLNLTAVDKILKKHDKWFGSNSRTSWPREYAEPLPISNRLALKHLLGECELVVAHAFKRGDLREAMIELRVPLKAARSVHWSNFRLGLALGIVIMLILLASFLGGMTALDRPITDETNFIPMMIVFRTLAMITVLVWIWGADIFIWTRHRINYVFIFEMNTRNHLRFNHLLEAAAILTLLWSVCVSLWLLGWLQVPGFDILFPALGNEKFLPFFLFVCYLLVFLLYEWRSRFYLLRVLFRIVTAPFHEVKFRDFFVADQLMSLAIVLYDLEFTFCYYFSDAWTGGEQCIAANRWARPVVSLLPSIWRLLQCLRRWRDQNDRWQLANAGKYATGIVVGIFSILRGSVDPNLFLPFWIIAGVASATYGFFWDVKKDWSLDRDVIPCCPEVSDQSASLEENDYEKSITTRLSPPRHYPHWWYLLAAVLDFLLRFLWILTISPDSLGVENPVDLEWFISALAVTEVMRRGGWNILRLENEHRTNVGNYRVVREIPVIDEEVDDEDD